MIRVGSLDRVERATAGSGLAVAANIGDTLLQVTDSTDFDTGGGQLDLNGTIYAYVSVEPDSDVVFLATTVSVAADVDDPVTALAVAVDGTVVPKATWTAFVDIGDGGNPPPADIVGNWIKFFADDNVQVGATVQITSTGPDSWRVTDLPDQEPL